jgi:cyclopropane fatty-acyl-phospholipid synthase-like methyltransferase
MLGPHLKYSSAWWGPGVEELGQAEAAMLALTAERAELQDGQDVLELGCGWGSLTLWMAERYPTSRITAVSNSATQRELIEKRAAERGPRQRHRNHPRRRAPRARHRPASTASCRSRCSSTSATTAC